MNKIEEFNRERRRKIEEMSKDQELKDLSDKWIIQSGKYEYTYNFKWLGRPVLQLPTDIMALQELIWEVKPDLIIETGIAHGGSIIFSASMLELLGGDGLVVGIDIDIREHNRIEIEKHPMFKRITLLEGSSIDEKIEEQVNSIAKNRKKIMVILDSFHTHEHVLKELEIYSKFVSVDSYLIVFDTNIEFNCDDIHEINKDLPKRPWSVGNNPWTAVKEFLKINETFIIDKSIESKIVFTSAPDGFLKKVK